MAGTIRTKFYTCHRLESALSAHGTAMPWYKSPMPFPESPRVIYNHNPLESVVAQLRFPIILAVETDAPAGFQNRIRAEYPLFGEQVPGQLMNFPAELLRMVGNPM